MNFDQMVDQIMKDGERIMDFMQEHEEMKRIAESRTGKITLALVGVFMVLHASQGRKDLQLTLMTLIISMSTKAGEFSMGELVSTLLAKMEDSAYVGEDS